MNEYEATEIAYKNGYKQGRADAAKEIFEEIDEVIERIYHENKSSIGDSGTIIALKHSIRHGIAMALHEIAELKKKYTEEK